MGWGVGMGIGWSTTPNNEGSGVFAIERCNGALATVYSDSGSFVPGIFVYENPEKTIPFTGSSGEYWNLHHLINTIGGYEISNSTGEVKAPLTVCPV